MSESKRRATEAQLASADQEGDVVGLLRLIRDDLRAGTRYEPKSPSEEATIEALDRLLFLLIERSKLERQL